MERILMNQEVKKSIMSATDYIDAVHKFILSQKLTTLCSDTVVHNKERDIDITKDAAKKFNAIQAWWLNMTEQNYKSSVRSATSVSNCSTAQKTSFDILRDNAATIIQSHYRRLKERRNFLKMMKAICLVQTVVRTWLTVKKNTKINKFCSASGQEFRSGIRSFRGWMVRSYHILGHACTENASLKCQVKGLNNSEIEAATRIQIAWKNFLHRSLHKRTYAATKIQSYYRGWRLRMRFMKQKQAITKIQSNFRRLKCWRAFQNAWKEFICRTLQNQTLAATRIQSHFRGLQSRRNFMKKKQAIIKIQSFPWLAVKKELSAIIIQSFVRGRMARREARRYRYLVVMIQSHWKGYVARKESRGRLKDSRLRMVESAKNVDDSKRIINRHLSALSVLLSMKSISGILHHCETLERMGSGVDYVRGRISTLIKPKIDTKLISYWLIVGG
ncbi:hypothetical protein GOBAR_AA12142 [Gossypium barbadense]|uniref:Uncharacterized protein n=1 Tax=Gossypium barbadense TaxID=3634 RepID=A0A2P5XYY2_GOSBA|nr:hypothetical protein GOBAR_AA12142 [Gossypium barbadense]